MRLQFIGCEVNIWSPLRWWWIRENLLGTGRCNTDTGFPRSCRLACRPIGMADDNDIAAWLEWRQVALFEYGVAAGFCIMSIGHAQRQWFIIDDDGPESARPALNRFESISDLHGDDRMFLTVQCERTEAHDVKWRQVAELHIGLPLQLRSTSLPLICTGPVALKSKLLPLIKTVPSDFITKVDLPTVMLSSSPAVMLNLLPTMTDL